MAEGFLSYGFWLITSPSGVLALASALILGLALKGWPPSLPDLSRFRWLAAPSFAAIGVLLAAAVLYAAIPQYLDLNEPTIAIGAVAVLRGQPLYYDFAAGGPIYALPYGPLLYLTHALTMAAMGSIAGSKIAGVLAFAAAWGAALLAFSAQVTRPAALIWLGAIAVVFGGHLPFLFWNRPEPFLLLCVTLSVLAVLRARALTAAVLIGVLAGAASGFKLHGALYLAPIAIWRFAMLPAADRLKWAAVCAAAGLAMLAAPFAFPQISFADYAGFIATVARQGLAPYEFYTSAYLAAAFAAPALFVLATWRNRDPPQLAMAAMLIVCLGLVTIVASKVGAGEHHLLPFAISAIFLLVAPGAAPRREDPRGVWAACAALVAAIVAFGPPMARGVRDELRLYAEGELNRDRIRELHAIAQRHPRALMGLGGIDDGPATYLRVEMVLAGTPASVEFTAWSDLSAAGVPAAVLAEAAGGCDTVWILPTGAASWQAPNFLTGRPVVDEQFVADFRRRYVVAERGRHYEVWTCTPQSEAA